MTRAHATTRPTKTGPRGQDALDLVLYAIVAALTAFFWHFAAAKPASLPIWAPWDFAPLQFISFWLGSWWFYRGARAAPAGEKVPPWRIACFAAGVIVTYAVMQTRFEYLAEHMFFLNRIQHIVMHHLGPLLIVLAWPGETIKRGMPDILVRLISSPWITRPVHWIQQPVLAAFIFVGLIFLWLTPSVHFRAMIDPDLYSLMNWSMVVDGILFWALILDPRPKPPARVSYLSRCGLVLAIMFPQIVLGAVIAFSSTDLYEFYHWCGRIYPNIGAMRDQMFGGLIVWIPGAMMSVVALLLVLNFMRQHERTLKTKEPTNAKITIDSKRWTGL